LDLSGISTLDYDCKDVKLALYEDDPFALMETMRQRGVLVEICLTSNATILNVEGQNHPFATYRAAGVPLTLASDDEGIARIDLSHEYHLAVLRHGLKYGDLKQLARNSLEYSFAKGSSLCQSPQFRAVVGACESDKLGAASLSKGCAGGFSRAAIALACNGNWKPISLNLKPSPGSVKPSKHQGSIIFNLSIIS
jgi:hypothetical protein